MNKNRYRNLWYSLSSNQRFLLRRIYYLPKDSWDKITGKRHKYVPPRGQIYTGSSANPKAYIEQSRHQLKLVKKYTDIRPSAHILDIGSGVGRIAIALTEFLDKTGTYDGFDVVKFGVD